MKLTFKNKIRVFIIVIVALLVVGISLFSFLGFNQDVDNKSSYEMQISLNQVAGESIDVLKASSVDALAEIGKYSLQELNNGATLICKFDFDVTEYALAVETSINAVLTQNTTFTGVEAEVNVYKTAGKTFTQIPSLVLVLGVSTALIFVYTLIMNKLSSAVAVLCSSLVSVLLFTALMATTRIPAYPFFEVFAGLAMITSSAIALAITSRYKALSYKDEKSTAFEIAEKAHHSLRFVFIALVGLACLASIIVAVIGLSASLFLGLGLLVAGLSAVVSAVYMTPLMWSLLKGINK